MRRQTPVHRVTQAARPTSDGVDERMRRYSITMASRIVCILLAALLPIPLWSKALFVVGAVVLPWIAVVGANGGDVLDKREAHLVAHTDVAQLTSRATSDQALVIESTAEERDQVPHEGGLRRRAS